MDTQQLELFPPSDVTGNGQRRPWAELAAEQPADLPAPSEFDVPLFPAEDVTS